MSSLSALRYLNDNGNWERTISPAKDDDREWANIEIQRQKWKEFLSQPDCSLDNIEIWQYFKDENRPSPVGKAFLGIFSNKIKIQKNVKKLIRGGVPPELRARVWWVCSGAAEKMNRSTATQQYGFLVQQIDELDASIKKEIEKDINRTFPGRIDSGSSSKENSLDSNDINNTRLLLPMTKVLSAYALRNPSVGYCQSMNFICALLLFHLSEEESFWVLAALIEDILPPDYYSPSMIGCRVDHQAFQSCIAWKLSKVHAHLVYTKTLLDPICCGWFLCGFLNTISLYSCCRVWDCLFHEGNIVLFRVAIAMMKTKELELCEATDFVSIYEVLKSTSPDKPSYTLEPSPDPSMSAVSYLLDVAYQEKYPRRKISSLRAEIKHLLLEKEIIKYHEEDDVGRSSIFQTDFSRVLAPPPTKPSHSSPANKTSGSSPVNNPGKTDLGSAKAEPLSPKVGRKSALIKASIYAVSEDSLLAIASELKEDIEITKLAAKLNTGRDNDDD